MKDESEERPTMLAAKEFAIPLALLLIGLLTYLLIIGRLGQWAFANGLVGVAALVLVIAVVLPRAEEVSEIGVKTRGGDVLVKLERIKEDVYAKAAEVQRLAEYVGRIAAFSVTQVGRFAPENLDEILLTKRDELTAMLREAGVAADRVNDIGASITRVVVRDLASEAANAAWQALNRNAPGKPHDSGQILREIVNRLIASQPGNAIQALRSYLDGIHAWSTDVEKSIARFDTFRTTGRLQR